MPGTNQVQSIAEWTPNDDDDREQRQQPRTLIVRGRQRALRRADASGRDAAMAHDDEQGDHQRQADQAEVGERLDDVAVGMSDDRRWSCTRVPAVP